MFGLSATTEAGAPIRSRLTLANDGAIINDDLVQPAEATRVSSMLSGWLRVQAR
ncbi:MAG: hypothetical protein JWM11_1451 [Planctomycetaceae bacterium]|nr:hypothetical protein [Planctomycetaceae bacterium]